MPDPGTDLPRVFAGLADDTRWRILVRLGRAPASASTLATEMPVSRQAIGKHLHVLQDVGLVAAERVGREVRFVAVGQRLATLAADLERIADGWEHRLGRIKAVAEDGAAVGEAVGTRSSGSANGPDDEDGGPGD